MIDHYMKLSCEHTYRIIQRNMWSFYTVYQIFK